MSKFTVSLTKKPTGAARRSNPAAKNTAVVAFNLQDNGDDTLSVFGVDAAGNQVDISSVATLSISSDNTALLTVDAPVGMTSAMHAVGPTGMCNLNATATWNDGSIGPFSFTLPINITSGPAGSIVITPGTPT